MKRYDISEFEDGMVERKDGAWVYFEDHERELNEALACATKWNQKESEAHEEITSLKEKLLRVENEAGLAKAHLQSIDQTVLRGETLRHLATAIILLKSVFPEKPKDQW